MCAAFVCVCYEDYNHQKCAQQLIISSLPVNGLATPGVLPPFLGLGTLPPSAYGSGLPGLGAFTLTSAGTMNSQAQAALRGISNVLLISNLNEEVRSLTSESLVIVGLTFNVPISFLCLFCFFISERVLLMPKNPPNETTVIPNVLVD